MTQLNVCITYSQVTQNVFLIEKNIVKVLFSLSSLHTGTLTNFDSKVNLIEKKRGGESISTDEDARQRL